MTELSDRIRLAAEKLGGLNKLAQEIGVPRRTLGNWLKGTNPKPSNLKQIADVANISLEWLISGTGSPEQDGLSTALNRLVDATGNPHGMSNDEWNQQANEWFSAGMANLERQPKPHTSDPAPFLDTDLMERLARVVTSTHRDLGISIAPEKVVVEVAILMNDLARTVRINDPDAITLALPVIEYRLRERLQEAKREPGTGKRLA
ncbi:helix-turn-helix transcriptional regulator [Agrobacterium vitis]|uniref:helix-turn-helix domain-containing protein n=1 Tax=Agrobacterium vitis TaxID=373 RepID=UPI0012E86B18|nr:helix-turn-helix transcriptional regulator [Agrobacterium vitis]MVA24502.1 helix-turn-helix domain-containing protein [Agrobacterium vitis]